MLSCEVREPGAMGRVIRDARGDITGVVESRDAPPVVLAPSEICCGAYCFRADRLWPALRALQPAPNGEYYITSLIENASYKSWHIEGVAPADPVEAMGVNDRSDLARVTAIAFDQTRHRLMTEGATLVDPPSTFVDATVGIGMDTVLQPGVIIQGSTSIGEGCSIGPNAVIKDSKIGDGCRIQGSVIEQSSIADRVQVGPYCHLRPGTRLSENVHIGNYVEIKESSIAAETKVGHFSYLGDAKSAPGSTSAQERLPATMTVSVRIGPLSAMMPS